MRQYGIIRRKTAFVLEIATEQPYLRASDDFQQDKSMNDALYRFFGGSPLQVLIRLIIISFVVGVILAALNIEPFDVIYWFESVFYRIYNMGFEAFRRGGEYFVLGAVIVFPVWLVMRLLAAGKRSPRQRERD